MEYFWNYEIVEELLETAELGRYFTYGLRASRRTMQGWVQIELLHDVTTDCNLAQKLATVFNLYQLSPVHLREVVNDVLP